ncbi:MAG: BatA and WFA domain-containing protein [Firmicutes bacterium]|nr:BatA and WFA domain-containing protein [Bacillota bacterium]
MTFLQPLAFWSALTIPLIIILYMMKKKVKPHTVSSIMLWERLDRTHSPSLKISRLLKNLLLLLQILIACLLVLALTQPALPLATGSSGSEQTIIIIDTSYSMAVEEAGTSRLEQAQAQARELINHKGSGDTLALIGMSEQARIVSGLTAEEHSLLQAVEQLTVTGGRANLQDAMALAENLSHALEDPSVIIISDGGCSASAVQSDLPVTFLPVGQNPVQNLMITDMVADGERLYVTIHNNGMVPAEATVQIENSKGTRIGQRQISLEAQTNTVLTWRELDESPWYRGELLTDDQLSLDNTFYVINTRGEGQRVLLVTEGNLFLERALMLQANILVTKTRPQQYRSQLAERYNYFVFDGFLPDILPMAPVVVFDPPHPNEHVITSVPFRPGRLQVTPHPITAYADFAEVNISYAKTLRGGRTLLATPEASIAVELEQQGQPFVVFGFAVQGGDLPLRPTFPVLIRNLVDYVVGRTSFPGRFVFGEPLLLTPSYQVESMEMVNPAGENQQITGPFPHYGEPIRETGIYVIKAQERVYTTAVNVPAVKDSLAMLDSIQISGGQLAASQQAPGQWPLLAPLLMLAFNLLALEWWVDHRGY